MSAAPIRNVPIPDPAADRALVDDAATAGARPPLTRAERVSTMVGVLLGLLLAGLDQTIVATAGPAIQRDLRIPASLYPWVTTAYLVSSTVMVPIYGKVSDRRGRKPVLLTAIGIFLLGSVLCGLSPTTGALIAARAVQGLGAAGLFTTAFAVIADLYPPRERGRYTGLIGAVMGLSSVVGPLVGGLITDRFGWHWVFLINAPVGAVALWFIATRMPKLGGTARHARKALDVAGIAWLVLGVVPLLVALSLGRPEGSAGDSALSWTSPLILGLIAVSLVGAVLFLRAERRAEDPIIDPRLFRNRTVAYGIAATFVLGAGFLSAVVFLPLFMVNVVGVSATRAGLTMTPLTLGMVAGSISSGRLVARTGRYKPLMLVGLAVLATGFAIMAFTLSPDSTTTELTLKMLVVGLGIGPTLPLFTLAVQNAASARDVGVVTAATTFARSLGQVIGVALVGTVFATTLATSLARESRTALADVSPATRAVLASSAVASEGGGEHASVSFDRAGARAAVERSVAPAERAAALGAVDRLALAFQRAFTTAIERLYLVGLIFVAVATALTLRIPQLPLRQHHGDEPPPPDPMH
jgi:EmrB/QacA subfamily drug resistance transporter